MSKPTYFELLRDPRWQRRRLEIMQRAGFSCEYCADRSSTLNVHHIWYEKGKDPWDYPDAALTCVCEECHEELHDFQKSLQALSSGMGFEFWEQIFGLALKLRRDKHPDFAVGLDASIGRQLRDYVSTSEIDSTETSVHFKPGERGDLYDQGIILILQYPAIAKPLIEDDDFKEASASEWSATPTKWIVLREIIYDAGFASEPKTPAQLIETWRGTEYFSDLTLLSKEHASIPDQVRAEKELRSLMRKLNQNRLDERVQILLRKAEAKDINQPEKVELLSLLKRLRRA